MALLGTCAICVHAVSTTARACPKCGGPPPKVVYCTKCGKDMLDSATVCRACGAIRRVQVPSEGAMKDVPFESNSLSYSGAPSATQPGKASPKKWEDLSGGQKVGRVGCLGVIAIVVLVIIGSFLSESPNDESRSTSASDYLIQSFACMSAVQSAWQNVEIACDTGILTKCQEAASRAQVTIDGADSLLKRLRPPPCLASV